MDTRTLSVFLSVADMLNFSRSSELLHMSVSAVSRTIQRLEDELGQPLLERDNRSVRLTSAGREFREYARHSQAEWQQLRRKLGSDAELAGEVSLYCSVTATYSVDQLTQWGTGCSTTGGANLGAIFAVLVALDLSRRRRQRRASSASR